MREAHAPSTRIFANILPFRVDFCISKIPLNINKHLKLTKTEAPAATFLKVRCTLYRYISIAKANKAPPNASSRLFCYITSKSKDAPQARQIGGASSREC
jgi:hypothetical protein